MIRLAGGGRVLTLTRFAVANGPDLLEAWAITAVATLAASLAAFFRARHVEET